MNRFLDENGNFVSMKEAPKYASKLESDKKQKDKKAKKKPSSEKELRYEYLSQLQEKLNSGDDERVIAGALEVKMTKTEKLEFPMLAEKLKELHDQDENDKHAEVDNSFFEDEDVLDDISADDLKE